MDEYCVDGKMGKGIYMYLFCKLMKHTEDVGNFELSIKFEKKMKKIKAKFCNYSALPDLSLLQALRCFYYTHFAIHRPNQPASLMDLCKSKTLIQKTSMTYFFFIF